MQIAQMVDVASLSDAQLRAKLVQFGFPVMPVTGTTRHVLKKKVWRLMENNSKINGESYRRPLRKYSSGEEFNVYGKWAKKDDNKRAIMTAPTSWVTLMKSVKKGENDSDSEMFEVASLSDAQLRAKLVQFGLPVMPVTKTTRLVLKKKLWSLMVNKSKINSESHWRPSAKYSSEEESDVDGMSTEQDMYKRATMAPPTSRATLRKSVKEFRKDSYSEPRWHTVAEEKYIAPRILKVKAVGSGFDAGNYSKPGLTQNTYKLSLNNYDYRKNLTTMNPFISTASSYVETTGIYPPLRLGEDVINKLMSQSYINQSPGYYVNYSSNASNYAGDRLNQIRPGLSQNNPVYQYPTLTNSLAKVPERKDDNIKTPFLTDFTKPLSQCHNNPTKLDDSKNDFDQTLTTAKMAVVLDKYPEVKLSEEQCKKIQMVVMREIWKSAPGVAPQFRNSCAEKGVIYFTCGNENSKSWLMEIIPKIGVKEGVHLRVGLAKDLVKTTNVITWIPKEFLGPARTEQIFKLLETQNAGLTTKEWHVVACKEEPTRTIYKLNIDDNSLKVLHGMGLKLYFGLTQLTFRLTATRR